MRNRHLEFELLGPIGVSWRNGTIVTRTCKFEGIAAAKAQSDTAANAFYERLNSEMANQPFMTGDRYSIADVRAMHHRLRHQTGRTKPDTSLTHLWRWHADVSARPSAAA